MLIYFNAPLVIIVPLIAEFAISEAHPKHGLLTTLLYLSDMFFFSNLIIFYKMISNVVHTINYLPEENKIQVEQINTKLKIEEYKVDPEQIRKHKSLNPFIEFKDNKTGWLLGTKGMGVWHDKVFFESLLVRSYEKIHGTKSVSEWVKKPEEFD